MKSTLDRLLDLGFKVLEVVMVLLLFGMVAMVFGNVVLRYAEGLFSDYFRSQGWPGGISISDEMSRYFFVWLTFIGAVVVHREHAHLGVESLVKAMPDVGRKVFMFLSDSLVLFCCAVFFWGTLKQHGLNASNVAPISGMPMTWVYGVGYFTSIGIGVMTLARLIRVATGTIDEAEVKIFAGDWDAPPEAGSVKGKIE
jgi:TRAP-type C4-dicarboxylate transport system permease small subunit